MHFLSSIHGHSHHVLDHFDKKVNSFAILGFIFTIAGSAFRMILPLILSDYLGGDKVLIGYYFSAFAVIEIFIGFAISYLFLKFSRVHIFNYSLLIAIIAIGLMNFVNSIFSFFVLDLARMMLFNIVLTALIYFISDFSTKKELSKNLSIRTVLNNIGAIIGVAVMGYVALYLGNESMFYFVPLMLLVAWLYFHHMKWIQKNEYITHKKKKAEKIFVKILKSFKDLIKREDLKQSSIIYLITGIWIAFMENYRSILITDLGYSVDKLGIVVSFSCVFATLAAFFVAKIKNLKDIKNSGFMIMISVSIMALIMMILYSLGMKSMVLTLPFVISIMVFLFFLQALASIRLIFFTYVFSPEERDTYTSLTLMIFALSRLALPLLVSLFISIGFELYQFFGVLSIFSLIAAICFWKRPSLNIE